MKIAADGTTKNAVKLAVRSALASSLSVSESTVEVSVTTSRRLAERKLASSVFTVTYKVSVPSSQSASLKGKIRAIANKTDFGKGVKSKLMDMMSSAGRDSSALSSSFALDGFSMLGERFGPTPTIDPAGLPSAASSIVPGGRMKLRVVTMAMFGLAMYGAAISF